MEILQRGIISVDASSGDDASAQPGVISKPFRTLSAAMKRVQSNDTVLIMPGPYQATPLVGPAPETIYNYGSALWLKDVHDVTITGVGKPSVLFASHGNGLMLQNCDNVTVDGVTFIGQGPLIDEPWYFALLLLDGHNRRITVRNCSFEDSGNHGIAHLFGPRDTCDSRFTNNRFSDGGNMRRATLGKDGAAIAVGGSDNQIDGNVFNRWLRGVELECGDFPTLPKVPTSRIQISNNRFMECYNQGVFITPNTPGGFKFFEQILIENNVFHGWGCDPAPAQAWGGGFTHEGIYITGGVGLQIIGNTFSDMWQGCGIRMAAEHGDITNSLICHNDFRRIGRSAVLLAKGALGECRRNRITGNTIASCDGYPVWLDGSWNVLTGNTAQLNPTYGFNNSKDPSNVTIPNDLYTA